MSTTILSTATKNKLLSLKSTIGSSISSTTAKMQIATPPIDEGNSYDSISTNKKRSNFSLLLFLFMV
jgi:hypothetical protein